MGACRVKSVERFFTVSDRAVESFHFLARGVVSGARPAVGLDALAHDPPRRPLVRLVSEHLARRAVIKLYGCGTAVALIKLYYIFRAINISNT